MRYDKDTVLNLWADGMSSTVICQRLKMVRPESVRVIVNRARANGDPRAAPRIGGRLGQRPALLSALESPANDRGMSIDTLIVCLLQNIVDHNLFTAVLDETDSP